MRIEKCYFCGGPIYPGHGIMFVRNDAKALRFCASRCNRHFKQKWNPRRTRWTKAYRKSHGKEMALDSSFEFEKRRNRPVKYDRELVATTIKVMKRVKEIKQAREKAFYNKRMEGNTAKAKAMALKELREGLPLVVMPRPLKVLAANNPRIREAQGEQKSERV